MLFLFRYGLLFLLWTWFIFFQLFDIAFIGIYPFWRIWWSQKGPNCLVSPVRAVLVLFPSDTAG